LAKGSFELAPKEVKLRIRSIVLPHTELGGDQCKWPGKGKGEFTVFLVETGNKLPSADENSEMMNDPIWRKIWWL